VFPTDLGDRWNEIDRIVALEGEVADETGAVINALPFGAGSYEERTPLMHQTRLEGIDV
jgi:hypothetical protein